MQKTILNLTVTLYSDNVTPIDIVINNPEPVLSGDDYFTMLQGSCIAHNVGYTSLLELLLIQGHFDLFEEVDELPNNSYYEDDAYDRYKDDKLLGLI